MKKKLKLLVLVFCLLITIDVAISISALVSVILKYQVHYLYCGADCLSETKREPLSK